MTQSKKTKKALLMSMLSVLICVAMLVGSTFAWFTDSVTSGNNRITAGNLDVEMYWADGKADPNSTETVWNDASKVDKPIFDYELWEPGYAVVRHIKISNLGTLALKYEISITAKESVGDLAKVIDVYYIKDGKQITERSQLEDGIKIGTLDKVLSGSSVAKGHISGKTDEVNSDVATIGLKMQETAGNEYQNASIGGEFDIRLVATQYTEESDSFDNLYDDGAEYPHVEKTSVPAGVEGAPLKEALTNFVTTKGDVTAIKTGALADFAELSDDDWAKGTNLGGGNVRLINKNGTMYILSKDAGTVPALAGALNDLFENNTELTEVDLSGLDLSGVTNFQDAFSGCTNLQKASLKGLDFSGITQENWCFGSTFSGCTNLQEVELDGLDLTNVTCVSGMFFGCSNLKKADFSNVKADSLTSTNTMFKNCSSLKEVVFGENFDTSKVKWMDRMFEGCSQLESLDLSNMSTDSATDMNHMFLNCSALTDLNLSSFNTENVTNMCAMFSGCASLVTLDLSSFNTAKVGADAAQNYDNGFSGMFQDCTLLQTIYASENFVTAQWVAGSGGSYSVFAGCDSLRGGMGTPFDGNKTGAGYARIDQGPSSDAPGYFTEKPKG